MKKALNCELVNLNMVYDLSLKLAKNVLKTDFKPEIIIAIARGGFVPARFLCDFMDISDLASIKVVHYQPGANMNEKAFVKFGLNADINNKKILLVDDINDTGDTFIAAINHLKEFNPYEIKTAVLHQKKDTKFNADFYCEFIKEWHWVVYPWAVVEDVSAFIRAIETEQKSQGKILEILKSEFGVNISEDQLNSIIELERLKKNNSNH